VKQVKPIPQNLELAPTLARRVFQLRELRNMTVKDLAKSCRMPIGRIEDIEYGLETWLSTTDRQVLAKALVVEPVLLQEVETRPQLLNESLEREIKLREITEIILQGRTDLECLDCGHTLKCSIQHGYDIEGRPIQFAKAFCLKCPFILR
jgi:transcriptional regulator with XRE-family HTH domain